MHFCQHMRRKGWALCFAAAVVSHCLFVCLASFCFQVLAAMFWLPVYLFGFVWFLLCSRIVSSHLWCCRWNTLSCCQDQERVKTRSTLPCLETPGTGQNLSAGTLLKRPGWTEVQQAPRALGREQGDGASHLKGGVQSSFDSSPTSRNG